MLLSSLETGRRVWGPCCVHRPAVSHRQDETTPAPAAESLTREIRCTLLLPKRETHWVPGWGGPEASAAPALPTAPPLELACGPAHLSWEGPSHQEALLPRKAQPCEPQRAPHPCCPALWTCVPGGPDGAP